MARGKHKQAAYSRRAQALADQITAAETELAVEKRLLAEAVEAEQALAVARARRTTAVATRDSLVEAELLRLRAEVEVLRPHVTAAERISAEANDRIVTVNDTIADMLGGGIEGMERLARISHLFHGTVLPNHAHRMSRERALALDLARGRRTVPREQVAPPQFGPHRELAGILHPSIDDVFAAEADGGDPASGTVVEAARRVSEATWDQVSRDILYTWHPMPWITDVNDPDLNPDHPAARRLGVTATALHGPPVTPNPAQAVTGTPPGPATTAARRDHLSQHDPADLLTAWPRLVDPPVPDIVRRRWPTPLHPAPLHQQPDDAVGAHHLYTRAAWGSWTRHHARSGGSAAAGTIAVGIAAAARYWLPPTQTVDMLDSEPVSDLDDLRLPYPQVFLTFAEPPHLPAQPELLADTDRTHHDRNMLDAASLTKSVNESDTMSTHRLFAWMAIHDYADQPPVDLWDLLASQGARVEGLLLLADSLGHLAPQAAWALAIPSSTGHDLLTRVVVSVEWQASAWRNQIINAAAVVAWADWHEPSTPHPGEPDHPGADDTAARDRAVRVLAVRRTRAAQPVEHAPTTGRTVAAHVRRGHWRRQHHGPGGQQVKRVRIAPTIVNAGQRDYNNRVYRLPIL